MFVVMHQSYKWSDSEVVVTVRHHSTIYSHNMPLNDAKRYNSTKNNNNSQWKNKGHNKSGIFKGRILSLKVKIFHIFVDIQ